MSEVAAQRTPLAWSEMEKAIRILPSLNAGILPAAVPYLLALAALENARGNGIWNHNWGNITTSDPSLPHFYLADPERRKFMSFPSHTAGFEAWVKRLFSKTHRRIIEAANRNDFRGFISGLRDPHPDTKMAYCPDCGPAAERTYRALVREFGSKVGRSGGAGGVLLALIALTGAGVAVIASRRRRRV